MTWTSMVNPDGLATAANSAPVVIASDQMIDLLISAGTPQSALNQNILLAAPGSGPLDAQFGTAVSYLTALVAVTGGAGITAGVLTFEGSNDGANWGAIPYYDEQSQSPVWSVGTISPLANTTRFFAVKLSTRYVRLRISTAFAGGTVSAVTRLSTKDLANRAIYGSVNSIPASSQPYLLGAAATTNAAVVKASSGNLFEVTVDNRTGNPFWLKFYNKASAPTVGTDLPIASFLCGSAVNNNFHFGPLGKRFSTGIAIATTTGQAVNDTAALASAAATISISYN